MRLALLGVRGSTPAPGPDFVRYGGHTSCVAVFADGADRPGLVLDAGTGLRELGPLLGGEPFRGGIVLSHLHWDHVQGLPFSGAVDHPGAEVDLFLPGEQPRELLARGMSPPHFPIDPGGLQGSWTFRGSRPDRPRRVGAFTVTVAPVRHKGGLTHGIRVEADGRALAYLPDHALAEGPDASALALAADADLLVHDAQYLPGESAAAAAYGHATVPQALGFARDCRAQSVLLTHHAPGRTDRQLDAVAEEFGEAGVLVARQGEILWV